MTGAAPLQMHFTVADLPRLRLRVRPVASTHEWIFAGSGDHLRPRLSLRLRRLAAPSRGPRPAAGIGTRCHGRRRGSGACRDGGRPVSYTHLTLPTIYSV